MAMLFYYDEIKWNTARSEITFINPFLSKGRGKRFAIEGVKRTVLKNEKLYMVRITKQLPNNHEDVFFKLFVLHDDDLKNFKEDQLQLVGRNTNGAFVLDGEFFQGMKKNTTSSAINKVSLKDFKSEKGSN